jgi:hypothetical protein
MWENIVCTAVATSDKLLAERRSFIGKSFMNELHYEHLFNIALKFKSLSNAVVT